MYHSDKKYLPEESSRPFDVDRGGFIIGEGSGILVLEELNHAINRNAKIYCEITGYASYGDAYHLTKPRENGEGGYRSMLKCLVEGNILPEEVDVINCHATSTEVGDLSEIAAIRNLFGNSDFNNKNILQEKFQNFEIENLEEKNEKFSKEKLKKLVLTANKTYIGHLLAAAGSVESIFSIKSMQENFIVDNKNTKNPIVDYFNFNIPNSNFKEVYKKDIKYVIKNSFAFGGVNTSVLYKRFE